MGSDRTYLINGRPIESTFPLILEPPKNRRRKMSDTAKLITRTSEGYIEMELWIGGKRFTYHSVTEQGTVAGELVSIPLESMSEQFESAIGLIGTPLSKYVKVDGDTQIKEDGITTEIYHYKLNENYNHEGAI